MRLDPSLLPRLEPLDPSHVRHYIDALDKQLKQAFHANIPVVELVRYRAKMLDQFLCALWLKSGPCDEHDFALIAVGGYGRTELHPGSDIDLLVLVAENLDDPNAKLVTHFLTQLWDLGLEIGHAVRSISECVELGLQDITIATSLLEARLITGSQNAFNDLLQALSPEFFWPSESFFVAKRQEQQQRHLRYRNTVYQLEPDLKHNPGGLRDIHTLGWIARRHFSAESIEQMALRGFLNHDEALELSDCRDTLWRIRFALQLCSGKKDNRLLFDHQRQTANILGYSDKGNRPIEQMMSLCYQTLRRVRELNELLLQLFDELVLGNLPTRSTPIAQGFHLHGHLIGTNEPDLFRNHPCHLLTLIFHRINQPHAAGISAATLRQIRLATPKLDAPLSSHENCRRIMMAILRHRHAIEALSLMHRHDLLSHYLHEWRRIVGQMQFDLFHAYTVDEHTIRALKILQKFNRVEGQAEHPLAHQILQRQSKPELLILALLFHDIGKGSGEDHSQYGARLAKQFCLEHELSSRDAQLVSDLVLRHLLMSITAQKRDICDPEVIAEFAAQLGSEQELDLLYCLTIADICATNDTQWNDWKGSLLRQLYFATQQFMRQSPSIRMDLRKLIREKQERCRHQLQKRGDTTDAIDQLWQHFRSDYFIRYSEQQILQHGQRILAHLQQTPDQPLVEIRQDAASGSSEILLYCHNRPNLFATVAWVLDKKKLSIHQAQIMTTRQDLVLDTFVVLGPDGTPIAREREASLQKALKQALLQTYHPPTKPRRMSKRYRQFRVEPRILFPHSASGHKRTLMELKTLDTPGLLAQIGAVFQQCKLQLHSAKITTVGEQVDDHFQLTDQENRPLSDALKEELAEKLSESLNNLHQM